MTEIKELEDFDEQRTQYYLISHAGTAYNNRKKQRVYIQIGCLETQQKTVLQRLLVVQESFMKAWKHQIDLSREERIKLSKE